MKLNCVTSYPFSNTEESCILLSVYQGLSYRPILLTFPSFPFHGIGKDAMESVGQCNLIEPIFLMVVPWTLLRLAGSGFGTPSPSH
jgi:hypothetical protein